MFCLPVNSLTDWLAPSSVNFWGTLLWTRPGLGAGIGAIGSNAGKDAAIGATAGLGFSLVKKGEPIKVPSETLLEFTLSKPISFPVSYSTAREAMELLRMSRVALGGDLENHRR